jgi:hypothetical protein
LQRLGFLRFKDHGCEIADVDAIRAIVFFDQPVAAQSSNRSKSTAGLGSQTPDVRSFREEKRGTPHAIV